LPYFSADAFLNISEDLLRLLHAKALVSAVDSIFWPSASLANLVRNGVWCGAV
jgi:hypothetical protein